MALSLPFSPSGIVAPMVGCSDLPFRLLCLRHGATVAYTEMLFSEQLVSDPKYVEEMLRTCPEEAGKVVVQICGNDPQVMAMATAICKEKMCGLAAIDINLGCPQAIAKAGRFGSYLHDRRYWPLLTAIIGAMRAECPTLPITCQIRIQVATSLLHSAQPSSPTRAISPPPLRRSIPLAGRSGVGNGRVRADAGAGRCLHDSGAWEAARLSKAQKGWECGPDTHRGREVWPLLSVPGDS